MKGPRFQLNPLGQRQLGGPQLDRSFEDKASGKDIRCPSLMSCYGPSATATARLIRLGTETSLAKWQEQRRADDVPGRLKHAGELRLAVQQASLEELGRLAGPPLSKDTIAWRLRRLLVTVDKHALAAGLPVELTDY